MQSNKVDYHIHTTCSDGKADPVEIIRQAKDLGYDEIAITDLGTVEGLHDAMTAAKALELSVLAGIEIRTWDDDGRELRLLGYRIDPASEQLKAFLSGGGRPLPEEAIAVIRSAGGTPVLAHPGRIPDMGSPGSDGFYEQAEQIIRRLKKQGLKGLECYHPSQDEEQSARFIDLAAKYHLHITRGSGFCGSDLADAEPTAEYR